MFDLFKIRDLSDSFHTRFFEVSFEKKQVTGEISCCTYLMFYAGSTMYATYLAFFNSPYH